MKDDQSISWETDLAWASNSMASTTRWCSLWLVVCRHYPECPVCSILSAALWGTWASPHWPARSSNHREVDYATHGHMANEAQSWIWLNNLGPGFPFCLFLIETIQLKTQTSTQLFLPLAQPAILQLPLCAIVQLMTFSGRSWLQDQLFPSDCTVPLRRDFGAVYTGHWLLSINLVLHPTDCGRFPVSMSKENSTRKISVGISNNLNF